MASQRPQAPVPTLAAAALRTGAWLYGGLWAIVAATSPWGPPGAPAVALLAPLAPLVLLATFRSLARGRLSSGAAVRPDAPAPDLAVRAHAFLSAPLAPPADRPGHPAPRAAGVPRPG